MKKTVVIAENDPVVQSLIESELAAQGYGVAIAVTGAEVLAKAKEYRPVLIILDIMVPQVSGFEVLVALKSETSTSGIPVLLLAANTDRHEVLFGLAMGAEDFISKPFSPNELAVRVKKILLQKSQHVVSSV